MRLETISITGFKSFLNATKIDFPPGLTGVVGPNGCGKSNIIDAVRWVMGESSAKQLRGESITDVIFNGSKNHQPIGRAFIELVFDNRDGKMGGQYAAYKQIAIKREVTRDGTSNYYLNGSRCRRRDVIDVFLGTGLSPRSYSIIEQGMISKIVEAKPDELRILIEDAAKISSYKWRRRETENRIKNTRENLVRIKDLREEINQQLEKLKRQAKTAERYKSLRADERLLKAKLLSLRWEKLAEQSKNFISDINHHEVLLEEENANLQQIETHIEKQIVQNNELNDQYNAIHNEYYLVGTDIAKIEQSLAHQQEQRQQINADLQQLASSTQENAAKLLHDQQLSTQLTEKLAELKQSAISLTQQSEESNNALMVAEQAMNTWEKSWDEFHQYSSANTQASHAHKTKIHHLEQQRIITEEKLAKIKHELQQLPNATITQAEIENILQKAEEIKHNNVDQQKNLNILLSEITHNRSEQQKLEQNLKQAQTRLQELRSKYFSLEALQQAALGKKDDHITDWLANYQLHTSQRLAEKITVEPEWEKAVETVLGNYLQAVCLENVERLATSMLTSLQRGSIILLHAHKNPPTIIKHHSLPLLSSKIKSDWFVDSLLPDVYVADNLTEALMLRHELHHNESIITREGIWVGSSWLRVSRDVDVQHGIIKREKEINELRNTLTQEEKTFAQVEKSATEIKYKLTVLEQQSDKLKHLLAQNKIQLAELDAQQQVKDAQQRQMLQNQQRLTNELHEQQQLFDELGQELVELNQSWEHSVVLLEENNRRRQELLQQKEQHRVTLQKIREQNHRDKEAEHKVELESQLVKSKLHATEQAIDHIQQQLETLEQRRQQLNEKLINGEQPLEEMKQTLENFLSRRADQEKHLAAAKQAFDNAQHEANQLLIARQKKQQAVDDMRQALANKRLQLQETTLRQSSLQEQITETEFNLDDLLTNKSDEDHENKLQEQLDSISLNINRLGAINLAAIEECEQIATRKEYLDKQNADLEEALTTLENAIHKIDLETRSRFKETFEIINASFQELFPKLFGGGTAHLSLVGEDLLEAGIAVMAKPPGKHITSIHLLSGGEKAMTAIALVFSLFQLNPSPFCMLDEVDAPLDDANVGRFCEMVKEMSQKVQFIFISHNKHTITMANHLIGVTMSEPGVSRIVTVDVDTAIAMADQGKKNAARHS